MALTKTAVTVLASVTVTAGSTKTSPNQTGSTVDTRTYYGGLLEWKITNGTAPSTPGQITFQASHDGTAWYDYYTAGGDITASSVNSGTLSLDKSVMYLRAIAYGNFTTNVTVEANLIAVTGL